MKESKRGGWRGGGRPKGSTAKHRKIVLPFRVWPETIPEIKKLQEELEKKLD